MDGKADMLAEIQTAIKTGKLTKETMERRLNAAIEAELRKTDSPADLALVTACQNLLWEINMHGEACPIDRERSLAAARAKLELAERNKLHKRRATGAVLAAAAVIAGGFVVDALLHNQRLSGGQSTDEQQYVISGRQVDPAVLAQGRADAQSQNRTITTESFDEAVSVLGYTPLMPTWLPEGWRVQEYYAAVYPSVTHFRCMVAAENGNELIKFSVMQYTDLDRATFEFEQNKNGRKEMCNDWTVYVTENTDGSVFVWQSGTTCYSLSGPQECNEMLRIVKSIQRSE